MSPHMSPDDDTEDRDLRGLYRHLPPVEPSAQLDSAIRGQAASAAASDRRGRRPHGTWHPGWGVAASVLAVCALLFLTDYSDLANTPTLDSESDETAAVDEEAPQPEIDTQLATPPPLGTYAPAPAPALPSTLTAPGGTAAPPPPPAAPGAAPDAAPAAPAVPSPEPSAESASALEGSRGRMARPAPRAAAPLASAPAAEAPGAAAPAAAAPAAGTPSAEAPAAAAPAAAAPTAPAPAGGTAAGETSASAQAPSSSDANVAPAPTERGAPRMAEVGEAARRSEQSFSGEPLPASALPAERAAEGAKAQLAANPNHTVKPPAGPDATSRIEYIRALLRNNQRNNALAQLHSLHDDEPEIELPPDLVALLPAAETVPAAPSPLPPPPAPQPAAQPDSAAPGTTPPAATPSPDGTTPADPGTAPRPSP